VKDSSAFEFSGNDAALRRGPALADKISIHFEQYANIADSLFNSREFSGGGMSAKGQSF